MTTKRDEVEEAFDKSMDEALTGGENAIHSPRSKRVANIVQTACAMYEDGKAELYACFDDPKKKRVNYTLTTYHPDKLGRHGWGEDEEPNMRVDAFRCMDYNDLRYCTDAVLIQQVYDSLVWEWDSPDTLEKAGE